jgi:hypothetical protein
MQSKHTQNAYEHKKAKRSGESERRGEEAFIRLQWNTPIPRSENERNFKQSKKV